MRLVFMALICIIPIKFSLFSCENHEFRLAVLIFSSTGKSSVLVPSMEGFDTENPNVQLPVLIFKVMLYYKRYLSNKVLTRFFGHVEEDSHPSFSFVPRWCRVRERGTFWVSMVLQCHEGNAV